MQNSVPKGWQETKLEELCTQITDGAHNSPSSVEKGYPMASVKDLNRYGINIDTCRLISANDFNILKRQGCKPYIDDVLIAKDGATALDTICQIEKDIDVVLLSSIAILRPNQEKINTSYLRYYLEYIRESMKSSFISGAAIPRVVLRDFKKVRINLPSLQEQKKLGSILKTLDDKIEVNNKIAKTLEEMAQAIFKEWFVARKKNDSDTGKLSDIAIITMGQSPASKFYNTDGVGLPFHQGVTNFGNRYIESNEVYCSIDGRIAESGDILFSVRAPVGRINIADRKIIIGRGLSAIRHKQNFQSYLYYLLRRQFRNEDSIGSGSVFPATTKEELNNLEVVIPDEDIIRKFENIVSLLDKKIELVEKENQKLAALRDILLPKLMKGEIRI